MSDAALRPGLPPLPARLAHLPVDARGFPVPWFVQTVNGVPDHRIANMSKMPLALKAQLCWTCGHPLQAFKSFVIGPMCSITRTISEPPSHAECAEYAAIACPFLTRPHAKRREAGLPDNRVAPAGDPIMRNPGVVCVWTTRQFRPFRANNGILFDIGEPTRTAWYAEGRAATRAEVDESIRTGLPLLERSAAAEGAEAVDELRRRVALTTALLDEAMGVT